MKTPPATWTTLLVRPYQPWTWNTKLLTTFKWKWPDVVAVRTPEPIIWTVKLRMFRNRPSRLRSVCLNVRRSNCRLGIRLRRGLWLSCLWPCSYGCWWAFTSYNFKIHNFLLTNNWCRGLVSLPACYKNNYNQYYCNFYIFSATNLKIHM